MTVVINGSTGITFPDDTDQTTAAGFASGTAMMFVQTTKMEEEAQKIAAALAEVTAEP